MMYIVAHLELIRKKTVSIRGKAIQLPEEEHFVFENHHGSNYI